MAEDKDKKGPKVHEGNPTGRPQKSSAGTRRKKQKRSKGESK